MPGPAFLKEYKAKPLATFKFNLRHSKGFDAVLSVMGWVPWEPCVLHHLITLLCPRRNLTETAFLSLVPHPCSSLMERGQEVKNLPGTSNSSQPLLLHRTLPHAHFSGGKRLRNPFVSWLCCSCTAPLSPGHSLSSPLAPGCLDRIPGPAPISGIVPKENCSTGTRHSSTSSQETFPTEKEHVENFSFFNRERGCLTTWRKETSTEQSTA